MNTQQPSSVTIDSALAALPTPLRTRLIKYYAQLKQAYARGDFDACGARAGKFCEILIRIVQQSLEGAHTGFGVSVNIYSEARRLEGLPQTAGPEPLRVFIPRALCFLYTLRNKRGFAHVGGDLDSEPLDAITCVRVADWCLCEIIRVVHGLPVEDAQALIDTLASREVPDVWSVAGKRRVLRRDLSVKQQTLLLLYSEIAGPIPVEDLFDWTEYSRLDLFKARVIRGLHTERLLEWDAATDTATISPTGIREVETLLGLPRL